MAALIVGLLGGLVGYAVGRPSATESSIAQLQEADLRRDAEQIVELTDMARRTGEELGPIRRPFGRRRQPGVPRRLRSVSGKRSCAG